MTAKQSIELWACPTCLGDLGESSGGLACAACGVRYATTASGQPDFRPTTPRTIRLEYSYDPVWGQFPWDIVELEFPPNPLPFEVRPTWEPTEVCIVRSVPPPTGPSQRSLDLGCGLDRQRFMEPLTLFGYEHTGIDIDGLAPDALADMHQLPFKNETFDLLVTSAVFEHVKNPHVAMAEAARVAKPGAHFVGSIAFNEPFHISYFHHSPLAVYELLTCAGFECHTIVLSNTWNVFLAHLEMGYAGARYPEWLRKTIAGTLVRVPLLPAAVKVLLGKDPGAPLADGKSFARSHSALVGFVATRTPRPSETRCVRG